MINFGSKLPAWAEDKLPESAREFALIDVGASGGLSPIWRQWEPHLRAWCFDPIEPEIARLRAEETNLAVEYHAAWVSCEDHDEITRGVDYGSNKSRQLTSSLMAAPILGTALSRYYTGGKPVTYSDQRFSIDRFCREHGVESVDILKIDTDGHDYYVIRGALETLRRCHVIGVVVEVEFHGAAHPHANTFANIDTAMRSAGFSLFGMDTWTYTRAALPGRFLYGIAGQTIGGHVQWGDCFYARDPVLFPDLFDDLDADHRLAKMLKLAAVYDQFGLPDCAAQLLTAIPGLSGLTHSDVVEALDLLVPPNPYGLHSHADYVAFFEADPRRFYPTEWSQAEAALVNEGRQPQTAALGGNFWRRHVGRLSKAAASIAGSVGLK